jgi:hypothetical protein
MTLKIHEFGETTRACNEVRWHLRIQADGGASARAEMATEEPPERLYVVNCTHAFVF